MKRTIPILIFSLFIISFTSCKKEQGCTDISADNHSNAAEEDDGSCTYTGRAYVYYSYAARSNFEDDGITGLSIYMDNEFVGIMGADESVALINSCYSSLVVTKSFAMGKSTNSSHLLRVENQNNGDILYTTEFQVQGGICLPVEVQY